MPKLYEHLAVDITPGALEWIGTVVQTTYDLEAEKSEELRPEQWAEVLNFANECRARLQHVMAGSPDISQGATVPSRSDEEGWLDE